MRITQIKSGAPPLPERKKAAAYARVSSGKDAMLHSLAAQVSYYSEYIGQRPDERQPPRVSADVCRVPRREHPNNHNEVHLKVREKHRNRSSVGAGTQSARGGRLFRGAKYPLAFI